ncbi:unnamed protein product [Blepharisma stoltei]|uniref:Uncharacterized protein n=1 Tax=Blepharisma stoltei TaxID=1481888 RepID=A0AAU9JY60_9CILI|nr:unnamed protein product [Blepharisma stoltei]
MDELASVFQNVKFSCHSELKSFFWAQIAKRALTNKENCNENLRKMQNDTEIKISKILSYEAKLEEFFNRSQASNSKYPLEEYCSDDIEIDQGGLNSLIEKIKELSKDFTNSVKSTEENKIFEFLCGCDNEIKAACYLYAYLYKESFDRLISKIKSRSGSSLFCCKYLYNISEAPGKKTRLVSYDADTLKLKVTYLDTPEPLHIHTCVAQLPNNKIFCFGNSCPVSGITLIIDSNCDTKRLANGTPCFDAGAAYLNNAVYAFGGITKNSNSPSNFAEMFDLTKNKWYSIQPLPASSRWCSCVPFNRSILVTGNLHSKIYQYDTIIDSFTELPIELKRGEKILFIANFKVYAIDDTQTVYESEVGNEYSWKKTKISGCIASIQNYKTFHKDCIYSSGINQYSKFCYYKFNLSEKKLEYLE